MAQCREYWHAYTKASLAGALLPLKLTKSQTDCRLLIYVLWLWVGAVYQSRMPIFSALCHLFHSVAIFVLSINMSRNIVIGIYLAFFSSIFSLGLITDLSRESCLRMSYPCVMTCTSLSVLCLPPPLQ